MNIELTVLFVIVLFYKKKKRFIQELKEFILNQIYDENSNSNLKEKCKTLLIETKKEKNELFIGKNKKKQKKTIDYFSHFLNNYFF